MNIPRCNSIIEYQTGDGFRTLLPGMLESTDIVICRSKAQLNMYTGSRAAVVTLAGIHKIEHSEKYNRVIMDTSVPRFTSKVLKNLCRLVKGKSICFLEPFYDATAVNCALYLLHSSGWGYLKVIKFNAFQHWKYAR